MLIAVDGTDLLVPSKALLAVWITALPPPGEPRSHRARGLLPTRVVMVCRSDTANSHVGIRLHARNLTYIFGYADVLLELALGARLEKTPRSSCSAAS